MRGAWCLVAVGIVRQFVVPGVGAVTLELVDEVASVGRDLIVVAGLPAGLGHGGLDWQRPTDHLPWPVDPPGRRAESDLLALVEEPRLEQAPGQNRLAFLHV